MRGLAHFLRPGTIVYLFKMKKSGIKKQKVTKSIVIWLKVDYKSVF